MHRYGLKTAGKWYTPFTMALRESAVQDSAALPETVPPHPMLDPPPSEKVPSPSPGGVVGLPACSLLSVSLSPLPAPRSFSPKLDLPPEDAAPLSTNRGCPPPVVESCPLVYSIIPSSLCSHIHLCLDFTSTSRFTVSISTIPFRISVLYE